jgi:hypothetical protein
LTYGNGAGFAKSGDCYNIPVRKNASARPTTRAIHSAKAAVSFDFYCAGGCEAEGHGREF